VTIDAHPCPDYSRTDGSHWIGRTAGADTWACRCGTSGQSPSSPGRAGGAVTHRVLVTGSRSWVDVDTIRVSLHQVWGDGSGVLVSGACPRGADRIAEQLWQQWGGQIERHPADSDWSRPPASPPATTRNNTNRANRE
jgi:hypothetical protein